MRDNKLHTPCIYKPSISKVCAASGNSTQMRHIPCPTSLQSHDKRGVSKFLSFKLFLTSFFKFVSAEFPKIGNLEMRMNAVERPPLQRHRKVSNSQQSNDRPRPRADLATQ
jgi:hypothetical protein